jgi:hypothetical protein
MLIIGVHIRVKRASIYDLTLYFTSLASISSMRSEISRPATSPRSPSTENPAPRAPADAFEQLR